MTKKMTKKQKAQLFHELLEDVKHENANVYFAETNEGRMAAAQRGMYALGALVGLAGGDLFDDSLEALQSELIDKFGECAFRPGCWFQSISDNDCEKLAAEHRRQYEKEVKHDE